MGLVTTSFCINLGGTRGRMRSASLRGGSKCVRDSTTFPSTTRSLTGTSVILLDLSTVTSLIPIVPKCSVSTLFTKFTMFFSDSEVAPFRATLLAPSSKGYNFFLFYLFSDG